MLNRAAWLLWAVLLAGCFGAGSGHGQAGKDTGSASEQFNVPANALAIRGVTTDEAIVPQEGVRVVLDDVRNTTTAATGAFAFADVTPGAHVLKTSRARLLDTTTVVNVRAPSDPVVRIVMPRDLETRPYHQVAKVDMFLQCGASVNDDYSDSTCQAPNGASDIACSTVSVCLGHPMAHNGLVEVDPGLGAIQFAQAEGVWDPTNPSSDRLQFLSAARTPGAVEFNNGTTSIGPNPVIMPWNQTRLQGAQVGQGHVFVFQVYPAGQGVVLNQKVELFVTAFFHYAPPQGWTLYADGEPQDPP